MGALSQSTPSGLGMGTGESPTFTPNLPQAQPPAVPAQQAQEVAMPWTGTMPVFKQAPTMGVPMGGLPPQAAPQAQAAVPALTNYLRTMRRPVAPGGIAAYSKTQLY
jgi:hypothetical protein